METLRPLAGYSGERNAGQWAAGKTVDVLQFLPRSVIRHFWLVRIRSRLPCGRNRPRQRPSKPCKGRGDRTRLALDFQRCSALALHGVSALLAANARRQRDEGQAPNWIQRAELRVVRAQSPCDAKTVSVPSTLAHRQPKIAIYLNSPSRGGFPAGSWLPQQ
jgi:hypothetical protein